MHTWEQCFGFRHPVCDMSTCVARCVKHLELQLTEPPAVSITYLDVNARDAVSISTRTNNLHGSK